jgi:hypothetical protein
MSEASRPRPSIDLDELERQLREAAKPRQAVAQDQGRPVDDPLAELARIVGQDDPFRGAFQPHKAAPAQHPQPFQPPPLPEPPRREPSLDWSLEPQPASPQAQAAPGIDGLRPPWPEDKGRVVAFDDYVRHAVTPAPAERDHYLQAESEPVFGPEGQLPLHDEDFVEQEGGGRRFDKKLVAAVAAGLLLVTGVGLAFMMRGGSSANVASGKAPPVIKADTGPTKIAPQNPGGVEVPDQNKQIYERGTQDAKAAKIVGGDEQPVDVAQATRSDLPGDIAGHGTTGGIMPKPVAPQPPIPGLGPARVVKTVPVRPDGSIADGAAPPQAMAMAASNAHLPVPGMTTGALPPNGGVDTTAATAADAARAKLPPIPPPAPTGLVATPPKPKAVPIETITATGASPAPSTPAAKATPPVPAVPQAAPVSPPAAPRQQVIASTQPVAPVAPADTSTGAGGFAVQLAAPASEQEAKDTLARLQRKFATELGSYKLGVRKADVGDRTVYRVRVSNLSRDDANILCTKLQAAGGVCFIAKN